ncbi:50S ribosomal protein L25 [Sedimentibacter sp. MB31-C6]|uniref:50S ribosomal protein L25 n=1 Tax=Sedimentibacter sp. MB31-C6 TaxID=3109366 RepID=UPI002DDD910A|nr:50S ribosomal protein L25 [Sedimentibacter sp. MB36-C1]WSI03275.1 50S ribosomal protein L25 [Sedimentibacter sp. MB36-C1]
METGTIKVTKRAIVNSRVNKKLRKSGLLPGNISGKGMESISVTVNESELRKGITSHGKNAIFNLSIDEGNDYTVMIKDIQISPVKGSPVHVDFQRVSMTEEIKAEIGIKFKGIERIESKRLLLVRQIDIIPVKGLPQDIPDEIEVDVTNMNAGETVCISDIVFPEGIIPEIDLEQVVVSVNEPKRADIETETDEASEVENEL